MKTCEACGSPIPRTKTVCEDCEDGGFVLDSEDEEGPGSPVDE